MSQAACLPRLWGMYRTITVVFAAGLAVNGVFMLFAPDDWYRLVPGVSDTGPLNPHFVRDVGCAFIVAAVGFGWMAGDRARGRPAALAGTTFLSLHALVHLGDLIAGREALHHIAGDVVFLFAPALLALRLTWPVDRAEAEPPPRAAPGRRRGRGIVARLAEPRLTAFERAYDYDTTYLRDVAAASGGGFLRFFAFTIFAAHREALPREALLACKLSAVVREDCGPCTQLVARMAEREQMAAGDIRAVLAADIPSMAPDTALAFAFANAVLDRDVAASDRLRVEVVERWGERALVTLAFAVASARVYPAIKYALGHGQACSRVSVAGESVSVVKRAPTRAASRP